MPAVTICHPSALSIEGFFRCRPLGVKQIMEGGKTEESVDLTFRVPSVGLI